MKSKNLCSTVKIFIGTLSLWSYHIQALFGGKTELELNGIGVIKESAEILAKTAKIFPTHKMVIAILGCIILAQGLRLLCKGLITIIYPSIINGNRIHGIITFLVGCSISGVGGLCALFCYRIAYVLFAK